MTNLNRYIELQRLLDQLERILAINEEIERLEDEALHDGVIFVRDGKGSWETSQLTNEERELFQQMEADEELLIVTVGAEEVQRVLDQIERENERRAGMIVESDVL